MLNTPGQMTDKEKRVNALYLELKSLVVPVKDMYSRGIISQRTWYIVIEYDKEVDYLITIDYYSRIKLYIRAAMSEDVEKNIDLKRLLHLGQACVKSYRLTVGADCEKLAKTIRSDINRFKKRHDRTLQNALDKARRAYHNNMGILAVYYAVRTAFSKDVLEISRTFTNDIECNLYNRGIRISIDQTSHMIKTIHIDVSTKKSLQYATEMTEKYPGLPFSASNLHFEADIHYEKGLNPILIDDTIKELKKLGAVKEVITKFMIKKMGTAK